MIGGFLVFSIKETFSNLFLKKKICVTDVTGI